MMHMGLSCLIRCPVSAPVVDDDDFSVQGLFIDKGSGCLDIVPD
jgi:hypothetical protein